MAENYEVRGILDCCATCINCESSEFARFFCPIQWANVHPLAICNSYELNEEIDLDSDQ
jgi:hypothetical protein